MNAIKRTLVAVVTSVFAVAALAGQAGQAGSRNDGSRAVQFNAPTVLSGVTILPGSYTLRWARESGSEEVRIEIARGRKVLASGNGLWIETARPSPYESLVYHASGGTNELAEIRFKQSADSIRIDAGETYAGAGPTQGTDTN